MASRVLSPEKRQELRRFLTAKMNSRGRKAKSAVYREVAEKFGLNPATIYYYDTHRPVAARSGASGRVNGSPGRETHEIARETSGPAKVMPRKESVPSGQATDAPLGTVLKDILRRAELENEKGREHERVAVRHTQDAIQARRNYRTLMKLARRCESKLQATVREFMRLRDRARKM
jgi:hypothetical protein